MRIISMSAEERIAYKRKCFALAEYLWPYYSKFLLDGTSLTDLKKLVCKGNDSTPWIRLVYAMNHFGGYKAGNTSYQYGDDMFYLTNMKFRAEDYAKNAFAGGESGLIAYRFQEAADCIGIDLTILPSEMKSTLNEIRDMGDSKPQPIVFTITEYDVEKLLLENGSSVTEDILSSLTRDVGVSFRYNGNLDLNISTAEML